MQISFSLNLPRDEASVPVVRKISGDALRSLGVEDDCVGDIELAVTEACTNVLKHAVGTAVDYEVSVKVDESVCSIRVIDAGAGFDHAEWPAGPVQQNAESGRGIHLMSALVDELHFVSRPEAGTIVHLEKNLDLTETAILGKLAQRPAVG